MNPTAAIQLKPSPALSFEKIAANKNFDESAKIREAARQFEAVLLRQILADVRKPVHHSNLESAGAVNAVYDDIITSTLADSISRSQLLGFARSLERELTFQTLGQPLPASPTADTARTSTPRPTHD